jgi:hypothetical protein
MVRRANERRGWDDVVVVMREDDGGTTYRVDHTRDRWATIRFKADGVVHVSVGPVAYDLSALNNNRDGFTDLDLRPRSH